MSTEKRRIGRRALLVGAGVVAVAGLGLGLKACQQRGAAGGTIEDALRLLREAVRASPDHLRQRAEEVVAGKDAGKIVAFVRDHVAVLPAAFDGDDPVTSRRFGAAATLRGGAGTLRDRADLLAALLTKAGFQAEVGSAERPSAVTQEVLYRRPALNFEPAKDKVERARDILAAAGVPLDRITPARKGIGDPLPAITKALDGVAITTAAITDLLPSTIPVVTYDDQGKRYAFALAELDSTDQEPAGLYATVPASALPAVEVTVHGVANPARGSRVARGEPIELVKGTWPLDAVLGRQLHLTFVPPQGAQALLSVDAADLPVRVPTLRLQTSKPTKPKTGPLMTVQGEIYTPMTDVSVNTRGAFAGPFGPVKRLTEEQRKKAIADAATIEFAANAPAFPEVELDLAVLDGNGDTIEGLDAAAFVVTEEGARINAVTVTSNAVNSDAPRVLIAYDASGSVSDTWPSPEARTNFEQSLAKTLTAAAAQTPFDVQVLGLGTPPSPPGWRRPVADEIVTALHVADPMSAVWNAAGGTALEQGAVAVVLVSDFVSDEEPGAIAANRRRLEAAGAPVFCLPIGDPDEKTIEDLLAVSRGTRLDPTDPATAGRLAELIKPLAAKRIASIYRLRYTAPEQGPDKRRVTVSLVGRPEPIGQGTYTKPAKPVAPASFVALYADVSLGGAATRCHLAGLPVSESNVLAGALDDPVAAAETRAAMYGVTTFAFEPGTPTTAAVVEDVLATYLSIEPLRSIWKASTTDQLVKKVGAGVWRTPGELVELFAPRPPVADVVAGVRLAVVHDRQPAPKQWERTILQPPAQFVVLGSDTAANVKAALTASVAQAVAEASAVDDSPARRLNGLALTAIPALDSAASAYLETVPAADKARWDTMLRHYTYGHVLVPAKGEGRAFWTVAPDTGVATALFLDQTDRRASTAGCGQPATRGGLNVPVSLLEPNSPLIEIPGVGPLDLTAIAAPASESINQRVDFGHASAYLGATVVATNPVTTLLAALGCVSGPPND